MSQLKFSGRVVICLTLTAVSVVAVFVARKWPTQTALFPTIAGTAVFFLSLLTLILILTGKGESHGKEGAVDRELSDDVDEATARKRTLEAFAWVIGFFVLILFSAFPLPSSYLSCSTQNSRARRNGGYLLP